MENPAKLMVKFGKTVNLGNYESQRIDISLEITTEVIGYDKVANQLYDQLKQLAESLLEHP